MWQGRSWRAGFAAASLLAGLGITPLAAAEIAPAAPPAAGAKSDELPVASAWQEAITGQVEAFRRADAVTAFSLAGAPFRKAFPDATTFMLSVAAAGYGPIRLALIPIGAFRFALGQMVAGSHIGPVDAVEVYRRLVQGEPLTEIATSLCVSAKTISTYKMRLMDKLQLSSEAALVRYAIRHRLFSDDDTL